MLRVSFRPSSLRRHRHSLAAIAAVSLTAASAVAQSSSGTLVVSRSTYTTVPWLPPHPYVWNNALSDGSFGITSKILLDLMTPAGQPVLTLEVPNSTQGGSPPLANQLVTSFPSKSELALNFSTDGNVLTFMGYLAPVGAQDISNANTPAVIDPTNPVGLVALRAVAQVDVHGNISFTATNAYSGNNGRAAILHNLNGANVYYTAGNAGNGANPQPNGVVLGAGAQLIAPDGRPEVLQNPGLPTPLASFNVTQLGAKADKIGKDDNFRGLTVFNNVVYFTKGSGGNGVNTVYFVDVSGQACPSGVGVPQQGAALPTQPLAYNAAVLQTTGLPSNMCILRGFPSALNSTLTKTTTAYPFGLWFADAKTLYVADEGDGDVNDAGATPAGLQKWVFDSASASWKFAYALQSGLGLGATYSFPGDVLYPSGKNPATGLSWAPITDGLRNIAGRVNGDGTATIWGITSTVSGSGDQGADPNKLVMITDILANTSAAVAALETFTTVRTATFQEVLRGVAFTPNPWPR